MPRFYCDYCDVFLTHDSFAGRKQHMRGRKHQDNVRQYYMQFLQKPVLTQYRPRIMAKLNTAPNLILGRGVGIPTNLVPISASQIQRLGVQGQVRMLPQNANLANFRPVNQLQPMGRGMPQMRGQPMPGQFKPRAPQHVMNPGQPMGRGMPGQGRGRGQPMAAGRGRGRGQPMTAPPPVQNQRPPQNQGQPRRNSRFDQRRF